LRPPRSLAARTYTDIRRWTDMPRGGHFAAMEQPEALAHEVQTFFRPLRGRVIAILIPVEVVGSRFGAIAVFRPGSMTSSGETAPDPRLCAAQRWPRAAVELAVE